MDQPTLSVPAQQNPASVSNASPRRGFLTGIAAIITGAIVTLTPLLAALVFAFDPICRKRTRFLGADADGFLPVARLSDLPTDGTPVRFQVKADLKDAWNLFKDRTLGTVYLRRIVSATPSVLAFNDTCPHLGCKVNYLSSSRSFYCPCHASAFELNGTATNKIPPRDMDTLDVRVDSQDRVWVKYQDFKGGEHKKEAIG